MGMHFSVGDTTFSGMSYGRFADIVDTIVSFLTRRCFTEDQALAVSELSDCCSGTSISPESCRELYLMCVDDTEPTTLLDHTYEVYSDAPLPPTFNIDTRTTLPIIKDQFSRMYIIDVSGSGNMTPEVAEQWNLLNKSDKSKSAWVDALAYFNLCNHLPSTQASVVACDFTEEAEYGLNQGFVMKVIEVLGYAALVNKPLVVVY